VWPIAVWWTNSAQEASAAARLLLRSNGENGSHPGLGAAWCGWCGWCVSRFARAGVALATGWAGAPISGLPRVGIRPGTAGFGGFRSFELHRALAVLAAFKVVQGGPEACTRVARASLRSEPQPTLPRQHLGWL